MSDTITGVSAAPQEPDKEGEKGKWQVFIDLIGKYKDKIFETGALATERVRERYDAGTESIRQEAEIKAMQAAEHAAKVDHQRKETEIAINNQIGKIFEADTPEAAKIVQLAHLVANNPEIAAQLEKMEQMYAFLKVTRGVRIEINEEPQQLEVSKKNHL